MRRYRCGESVRVFYQIEAAGSFQIAAAGGFQNEAVGSSLQTEAASGLQTEPLLIWSRWVGRRRL